MGRTRAARLRAVTIVILLAAWEALARSGLLYADVVPPLGHVVSALARLLLSADTYRHLGVTAGEVAAGFVLGFLAGLAVGLVMGTRPFLDEAITPYIEGLATAPKIVFLPVAMLALGIGVESKIAIGGLSAFFPVALNTAAGMREVSEVWIRVGRSFRLSGWQLVRRIYAPALRRSVVVSMRLGFGLAVVGVVLAEVKLANRGLGFLAGEHYSNFRIPDLYAVVLLLFLIAVAANHLIGRLLPRH